MDLLANGPVLAEEVRRQATSAELAWSTVRRGKRALNILSRKRDFGGAWEWVISPKALKTLEDAQDTDMSTFGGHEHLREVGPPQASAGAVGEEGLVREVSEPLGSPYSGTAEGANAATPEFRNTTAAQQPRELPFGPTAAPEPRELPFGQGGPPTRGWEDF